MQTYNIDLNCDKTILRVWEKESVCTSVCVGGGGQERVKIVFVAESQKLYLKLTY